MDDNTGPDEAGQEAAGQEGAGQEGTGEGAGLVVAGAAPAATPPLMPLSMPPLHDGSGFSATDPPTLVIPVTDAPLPGPRNTAPLMPLSMPSSEVPPVQGPTQTPSMQNFAEQAPPPDAWPPPPSSTQPPYGGYPGAAGYGQVPPPPPGNWDAWSFGEPPSQPPAHRARRAVYAVIGIAVLAAGVGAGLGAAFSTANTQNSNSAVPPNQGVPNPSPSKSSNVVSNAARAVIPSIVDIQTSIATEVGQPVEEAAGTGMIISSSGLVVTNNHVVDQATSIKISIQGRSGTYVAKVLGVDPPQYSDVALLQIKGVSGLPYIHFGDSSTVTVGQPVVAMGNALGLGGAPSVVSGIVSALNRTINASDGSSAVSETLNGLIQTDAPISPGDSGGPLISSTGDVIGMDTAASSADGSGATLGFAIPANTIKTIISNIENHVSTNGIILGESPFLGIYEQPTTGFGGFGIGNSGNSGTTTGVGVTIGGVTIDGPAAGAGLQSGDVITSIAGQKTGTWTALEQVVAAHHPGSKVALTYVDGSGAAHTVTVQLTGIPK